MTVESNSAERILHILKRHGEMTSAAVAKHLCMTSMGARQHLLQLQEQGKVWGEKRAEKVGRPSLYWRLTALGHQSFNVHDYRFSNELLIAIQDAMGDEGVQVVLDSRQDRTLRSYRARLMECIDLHSRLVELVIIREQEGYMASMYESDGHYYFVEDHCPICEVAKQCNNLCDSELQVFQLCFADLARVSRVSHLLEDDRHCVYQFTPSLSSKAIA